MDLRAPRDHAVRRRAAHKTAAEEMRGRRRENDDGNVLSEEHRDRFTTVIKAIDMTPDSPHYSRIIQIK